MQWKVRIFFGKIKITFMFTSFSFSKTCLEKWYHPSHPAILSSFLLLLLSLCLSFFQKISSNLCNWPKHAISINCQTFTRREREEKKKYFCSYPRTLEKCYCDCFGTLLKLIREVYTDKASTLKHFLPKSD